MKFDLEEENKFVINTFYTQKNKQQNIFSFDNFVSNFVKYMQNEGCDFNMIQTKKFILMEELNIIVIWDFLNISQEKLWKLLQKQKERGEKIMKYKVKQNTLKLVLYLKINIIMKLKKLFQKIIMFDLKELWLNIVMELRIMENGGK